MGFYGVLPGVFSGVLTGLFSGVLPGPLPGPLFWFGFGGRRREVWHCFLECRGWGFALDFGVTFNVTYFIWEMKKYFAPSGVWYFLRRTRIWILGVCLSGALGLAMARR